MLGLKLLLYQIPAAKVQPPSPRRGVRAGEWLARQALAGQKTLPAGPFDPGAGSNAHPGPRER